MNRLVFITQLNFPPHVSTLSLIFMFPIQFLLYLKWELLKQQFDQTIIEGVIAPFHIEYLIKAYVHSIPTI